MLIYTVADYSPQGSAKLLNVALVFVSVPADDPAAWKPADAWDGLQGAGADPVAVAAGLDQLVADLDKASDPLAYLEELGERWQDLSLEMPVPLLYDSSEEAIATIRGALESRASVPVD